MDVYRTNESTHRRTYVRRDPNPNPIRERERGGGRRGGRRGGRTEGSEEEVKVVKRYSRRYGRRYGRRYRGGIAVEWAVAAPDHAQVKMNIGLRSIHHKSWKDNYLRKKIIY